MKKFLVIALLLTSCGFKSERISLDKGDKALSKITDEWVKTDTILALEAITKKMDNHKGLQKYLNKKEKTPVLFIGEIQNETTEPYLPIKDFNDKLLTHLLENGSFKIIDNKKRNAINAEIMYQNSGIVDPAQAKKIGRQTGADLAIFGSIIMNPKTLDGKTIKEYSVNLRITELETSDVIWMGSYDTTKYSNRSTLRW